MNDNLVILAEWPRNTRDVIRVTVSEFRGFATLDIREWYPDGAIFKPGRKGISLPLASLRHLAKAVDEAKRIGVERGLIKAQEAGR